MRHKGSLAGEGVPHTLTFDLDLYLQGLSVMTLQILLNIVHLLHLIIAALFSPPLSWMNFSYLTQIINRM